MLGEGYVIHCVWSHVSAALKQRHAFSQTSKQFVVQAFCHPVQHAHYGVLQEAAHSH
jgi:hypothetical protein